MDKIKWEVCDATIESCHGEPDIVKIILQSETPTGLIQAQYTTFSALKKEIENRLNGKFNKVSVKNVIFNPPATIIFWEDKTKTVVKCQDGEPYDAEKGFVMAYLKKLLGNDNTFNKEIKKWVKYEPKVEDLIDPTKPLTIEDLEKMSGQKVWLSSMVNGQEHFDDEYCGFYRVSVEDRYLYGVGLVEGERYTFERIDDPYGFKAYREPPKGGK